MIDSPKFEPDWISPPGDTIADALEELGMTQVDFAHRTGFTKKHINGLVKGHVEITAPAAIKLESVLGEPAAFWLRRDAQYREALARREALEEAESQVVWLKELPVAWLVKQGWIAKVRDKAAQVTECLRFFGVASVDAWREVCEKRVVAFRASPKRQGKAGAIASWLRKAELRAEELQCGVFDRAGLVQALPDLRALTAEKDLETLVAKVRDICGPLGIAVVFLPDPPGCRIHGATRWLTPDNALLALSLRYKSDDQLWFSFFHEIAHLLKHGKKMLFIEGLDGLDEEREKEADRFARDLLLSREDAALLRTMRSYAELGSYAQTVGVSPGVLVGRMQHERWIGFNRLNDAKTRFDWPAHLL